MEALRSWILVVTLKDDPDHPTRTGRRYAFGMDLPDSIDHVVTDEEVAREINTRHARCMHNWVPIAPEDIESRTRLPADDIFEIWG